MIQIQKKEEQFNTKIFGGRFIVNKPVVSGFNPSVAPYSSLFYWSHAVAVDDCEFGLHPHKGFEIMTFILSGEVSHFDTATNVWTPLKTGDFQIIQSNSGVEHQERISKGTRSFQIWFDPDFNKAIRENAAYKDYDGNDFETTFQNNIKTITYIGQTSDVKVLTPGLTIKKLIFDAQTNASLPLDKHFNYTFYVLSGSGLVNKQVVNQDDAIRITDTSNLDIDFKGELFYIQTPAKLTYTAVWDR